MEVLDIQDPKRLVWRGRYESSQVAYGVQVAGSTAYVAASEVVILDLKDPVQPVQIGAYTPGSYAYDIFVVGNLFI